MKLSDRIPLGSSNVQDPLFPGILSNEHSYEGEVYTAILTMTKGRIMGFDSTFSKLKEKAGDKLLPVYVLVEHGSRGSYSVVYIRK